MDIWSRTRRSAVMSRIRSCDTRPELLVRSILHRSGIRYSLRRKDLPGRPDIVLPKYQAVIFVHGCFWHRHKRCPGATTPGTRAAFWQAKFKANVLRDRRNSKALRTLGWRTMVVWECEVNRDPHAVLEALLCWLGVDSPGRPDTMPDRGALIRVAEERLQWNLGKRTGSNPGARAGASTVTSKATSRSPVLKPTRTRADIANRRRRRRKECGT